MSALDESVSRAASGRILCPRCGAETNRHAEKVDFGQSPGESVLDAALGGAVAEFHTCPGCRYVVERRVP